MYNSVHTHATVDLKTKAVAHPKPAAAHEAEPQYLGTFKNAKSLVEGDIFRLDDHTIYIQGFSFDGHAPNAVFWSDGIEIPYYTREAKLEPFLISHNSANDAYLFSLAEQTRRCRCG